MIKPNETTYRKILIENTIIHYIICEDKTMRFEQTKISEGDIVPPDVEILKVKSE